MKPTPFLSLTGLIAVFFLMAGSCSKPAVTPSDTDSSATGALRVSASFAAQTSQFAFDLAHQVAKEEGQAKNFFVSPLSLHIALGMLLNGADGQTAQEIQKTLKLDAQTLAEANQTYRNLTDNLPAVDPGVTFKLANSVWSRTTFPVETSFLSILKQTFDAEASTQDFNDPATVGKINVWASEHTNGRIPKVLDQIQPDNVMFLLNALYFKGNWKAQFNPEQTVTLPFTLASGSQVNVPMMRLDGNFRRAFQPGFSAVELPYGDDKFAMTVLLPAENTTADAVLANLNQTSWTDLQRNMTLSKIDFGLPRFTLNYAINLTSALSTLGMPTAFTNKANFSKINAKQGLLLSFVKQNTFIAVDEKGTEAAAVTTGGMSTTSIQLPTLYNRPFVLVIHEKTSGTILFVGKIADPTKVNS
ncbi:serpin family protein [Spirosoma sp. KUDC1026]|uniref:serpin family protein n=1 Tax=Spirosoma sp. KUDC1026 TaxID=2745947 RepID=UPI00159BA260|nr:serpin family protein [Spirosoma sp. KUDC1026]QKZ11697.1 serpin family protein [Spirosoma sp. KUDC1026]